MLSMRELEGSLITDIMYGYFTCAYKNIEKDEKRKKKNLPQARQKIQHNM